MLLRRRRLEYYEPGTFFAALWERSFLGLVAITDKMDNPLKILIVEDNDALGENIRDILEINGYTVDNFSSGKEALLFVQNKHFDIALIDIQLPDTKGTELVEKIAVISPATRYIYITGHATLDSTIRAIKQKNVVSYEIKPLDIDRLLLTIQQVKITIETEVELRKSEDKYRRLVESLRDNYFFFTRNVNGIFTYISPSLKNILGYTPEEFQNTYFEYLTNNPSNSNAIQCSALSTKGIKQPPYEVEIYHKDGSIRILQLQEVPVFDHEKKVISIEGIAKDITEIKTSQSQLVFLADHDPLTCQFNRRRFKKELERCLLEAQRNYSNGALLFLDLDNFKYVNDTLGHQYGDELLIKLANILSERLRQTDILAGAFPIFCKRQLCSNSNSCFQPEL